MHIILNNWGMISGSGSETFVRDLALSLRARGHCITVYAPILGEIVDELREKTIACTTELNSITSPPDILIGSAHNETVAVLEHFPTLRAISICHDRTAQQGIPPRSERIHKYVAVDEYCLDRLLAEHGLPKSRTTIIQNGVDISRFLPRSPLPSLPRSAALFSNYATYGAETQTIRAVCTNRNIELTTIGSNVGNQAKNPEDLLGQFDIVFAKARCAMEAMAVGCAVIVMSEGLAMPGLAGPVTPDNMLNWRARNFGRSLLEKPVNEVNIHAAIAAFDPLQAQKVQAYIRSSCTLDQTVDAFEKLALSIVNKGRSVFKDLLFNIFISKQWRFLNKNNFF